MADIEKLPLPVIREIVEAIEWGRSIEPRVLETYPWIITLSREAVAEIYGERFSTWTFQTLPVFQDIHLSSVEVVTANPSRLWIEMSNDRAFSWGLTNKNVDVEQVVFKYEMTPERVLVYMPMLIEIILDMSGDTLGHWKTKYGKSLKRVLTDSLYKDQEEKLVVNVQGLQPELMDFRIGKRQWKPKDQPQVGPGTLDWLPDVPPNPGTKIGDAWWWEKKLVWHLMLGWEEAQGPEHYIDMLLQQGAIKPTEEWPKERMIEYMREVYQKIAEFYAP